MQDWEIQFYWPDVTDRRFVHRLLYALVTEGVRYNAGEYPGRYRIFPVNPNEEIAQRAATEQECTERLADIVDLYAGFDPTTTEMGIHLAYIEESDPINFDVGVVPADKTGCRVRLSVVGNEIQTEDRFQSFVNLCASVFQRVGFPYGSFRSEYDDWIPTSSDEFLQEQFRRVTFLAAELVERFGRQELLSAPTERTVEFANEGVMLLVTPGPLEEGNRVQEMNEYLDLLQ